MAIPVPRPVQWPRTFVTYKCDLPQTLYESLLTISNGRVDASQICLVQTSAQPLSGCVTLGKPLDLSGPSSFFVYWVPLPFVVLS